MSARRTGVGASAPVAPGVKRYVKSCMDNMVELKVVDFGATGLAAPGTSGAVSSWQIVPAITQGTSDAQRTGNVIKINRLLMRGAVGGSADRDMFRVIVFRDMQSNGTTPAVTDILYSASYMSCYNASKVTTAGGSRFSIIKDQTFSINAQISAVGMFVPFTWDLAGAKCNVTYTGNTGTSADVGTNNIWLLTISSGSAVTALQLSAQLHYRDL